MSRGGRGGPGSLSAGERLRQAVEKWFITEPLLFSVWMSHRLVERRELGGIRAGQGRIEYGPEYVLSLPAATLEEVVRLEATRIVLKHPYVRRKPDPEISYLASNITLQEYLCTRLPIPRAFEVFGDRSFDRQYYEFYYDQLAENEGRGRGSGPEDDGSATWMVYEDGSGGPGPRGGGARGERGKQGPRPGPGDKGAAAQHLERERGAENTALWDRDEMMGEEINDLIRQAQHSNTWGTLSANLQGRLLAALSPKVDYRKMLREFRRSILSSRRELTRMKPNRRYGFVYMGSRHSFCTRLLFAVDVSGSMSGRDLENGFSVMNRLFRYGIETLDTVQFDVGITTKGPPEELRKARRVIEVTGRGGTDFAPILKYIDEHREYDGLVIFTDGQAARPPLPENRVTKVLWLFNHETTYKAMKANVEHTGKATFIRPA